MPSGCIQHGAAVLALWWSTRTRQGAIDTVVAGQQLLGQAFVIDSRCSERGCPVDSITVNLIIARYAVPLSQATPYTSLYKAKAKKKILEAFRLTDRSGELAPRLFVYPLIISY